jgi:K+-sensing histidine kinase KdpD
MSTSTTNLRVEYGFAVAAVAVSTALCFVMFPHFELTNLVMVYLLGTLAVASRGHRGPAALSAVLSVICFDFFFVPPRFTFNVSDTQYIWTFVVMFVAAMLISHLTIRLREEAEAAREGEQRSAWLMEKAKKAEIDAETERLRSSLLSSVSHDLRTPLAAILGSASTLLEKEDLLKNRTTRELLENIETESQRLSQLVQNLLETTRLETGVHLNKELYPLEEVIGSALGRMEKALKDRQVKIEIPEDLPLVPMDAILMEQVFVNLLQNGLRYTAAQSELDVSAHEEGGSVKVAVADRGSGLKDNELERVFDKFYHDPASPGAGLGLAICRAVVNAHGGKIWAENRPGGGAVFQFTLPLGNKHAD